MVQLCQDVINIIMNYKNVFEENDILSTQVVNLMKLMDEKGIREITQIDKNSVNTVNSVNTRIV